MKIAVVGSGISGLTAAYHLSKKAEVHLFEADARLGGHTNTIDVDTPAGPRAVDTGFIVFNDWTYPRFIRLMDELGVASQPSDMSFSVRTEAGDFEYNGTSLNTLFAQRLNLFRPSFHRMIKDILRFNREAPALLEHPTVSAGMTIGEYLDRGGYDPMFVERYIVPMGAAIWSAGVERMREIPALFFVRFFKNHGMLSIDDRPQWRVVRGGSRAYVPAITAPFADRVVVGAPVRAVRRVEAGVVLSVERAGRLEEARFDHVVFASHADQTLAMLADATALEREILSSFPYQENDTVLHTDASVMPRRRLAWAAWNYWLPAEPSDRVAVTYDMNILQTLPGPETFFVSLNMGGRIDPAKVIRRITYHHPVFTAAGVGAQGRWGEISGCRRTHFCGAYWRNGFHEDGVVSAERVVETFGVRL